jgi:hypothetical protein
VTDERLQALLAGGCVVYLPDGGRAFWTLDRAPPGEDAPGLREIKRAIRSGHAIGIRQPGWGGSLIVAAQQRATGSPPAWQCYPTAY